MILAALSKIVSQEKIFLTRKKCIRNPVAPPIKQRLNLSKEYILLITNAYKVVNKLFFTVNFSFNEVVLGVNADFVISASVLHSFRYLNTIRSSFPFVMCTRCSARGQKL